MDKKQYLTVDEAAQYVKTSPLKIHALIRQKKLKIYKCQDGIYKQDVQVVVNREELDEWISSQNPDENKL